MSSQAQTTAPFRPTRRVPPRTRTEPRPRSAAANKAYARRAHRTQTVQRSPQLEKLMHRGSAAARAARPVGARLPRAGTATATRSATASFVVLIIGLLVVGVAATLWLSTQATADSYRLENLKDRTTALSEQREQLQAHVDQANSATSLAQRAQKLGMVPAGDPAHLVVGRDGHVTVVGTPKAAQPQPKPQPQQQAQQPQQPQQRQQPQKPRQQQQPQQNRQNQPRQRQGTGRAEHAGQQPAQQAGQHSGTAATSPAGGNHAASADQHAHQR